MRPTGKSAAEDSEKSFLSNSDKQIGLVYPFLFFLLLMLINLELTVAILRQRGTEHKKENPETPRSVAQKNRKSPLRSSWISQGILPTGKPVFKAPISIGFPVTWTHSHQYHKNPKMRSWVPLFRKKCLKWAIAEWLVTMSHDLEAQLPHHPDSKGGKLRISNSVKTAIAVKRIVRFFQDYQ